MDEVSIIGVDLAKQVFQVHDAACDGRVLFRKKLARSQFSSSWRPSNPVSLQWNAEPFQVLPHRLS